MVFDSRSVHRGVGNPSESVRDVVQIEFAPDAAPPAWDGFKIV